MEKSITSSIELCDVEIASVGNDTGNDFVSVNEATAQTALSTDLSVLRTLVHPFTFFGALRDTEIATMDTDTHNDISNISDTIAQSTTNGSTFVIRMWVQPFTIVGRYISPGQYQTKLPPSLLTVQQNQVPVTNDFCTADYQLQEWILIWERIKNIQYQHPGYPAIISMIHGGTISIIYSFFVKCIEVYQEGFLVVYCLAVTLMIVLCYVKNTDGHRFIRLHWKAILAITVIANVVAYFAMVDTFQSDDWPWYLMFLIFLTITMTPIGCIHLCIPPINAYCRYYDQHDEVLRKIYYEIRTINNEVTCFTLRPIVGFDNSNIAVDVYIDTIKEVHELHKLSSCKSPLKPTAITTTLDIQKPPNCSDDGLNDPLLLFLL